MNENNWVYSHSSLLSHVIAIKDNHKLASVGGDVTGVESPGRRCEDGDRSARRNKRRRKEKEKRNLESRDGYSLN